ncbi:MAG: flagellar export protein FliJ [Lachnospiraceae bacterium]|nr:flagellar export protein FliJ [Lachnospiraceae bacterium]
MARFIYRMQNILNLKEKMETQAKNEFAEANMKAMEEEDLLEQAKQHLEDSYAYNRELMMMDHIDVLKLNESEGFIRSAKDQVRAREIQLKMAQKKVEEKRVLMQRAMQERKTQEILKEHAFETFLMEEKAAENKEIDQLTSYTHGQKIKEE